MPKAANRIPPAEYAKLKAFVHELDAWTCVVCRMWNEPEGLQIHHNKGRGAGGADAVENCYTVCHFCHRAIEDGRVKPDWKEIDAKRDARKSFCDHGG